MPGWQQLKHALTRPAGFSADGRRLGLGLDTALDAQRRETDAAVADIERFVNKQGQNQNERGQNDEQGQRERGQRGESGRHDVAGRGIAGRGVAGKGVAGKGEETTAVS
ncbi:hypothetical protein F4560_008392 [Saccharothrix ecbatanensis]|uniref:Uncharacterized protein n=1 Tax=Saccharothrix ecbatanensis TaxID=1105145 RepID=A0A7W9HUB3_9PSEU|nr:hypothetical protein [Saccharothrix ecbatanensis]MBB5808624.1 hypothetical protein [Saccharothrix ecbatanensis]